jgi:hypothetical protein
MLSHNVTVQARHRAPGTAQRCLPELGLAWGVRHSPTRRLAGPAGPLSQRLTRRAVSGLCMYVRSWTLIVMSRIQAPKIEFVNSIWVVIPTNIHLTQR